MLVVAHPVVALVPKEYRRSGTDDTNAARREN
jgi:hypothetical protein